MRIGRLLLGLSMLAVVASLMFLQPGSSGEILALRTSGQEGADGLPVGKQEGVIVSEPVTPGLTVAVRDLPPYVPEPKLDREVNPRQVPYGQMPEDMNLDGGPDPLLALQANAPAASDRSFDTPIFNFDGEGYQFLNPPDTVGDVGKDHYIQMVNATIVTIYDKATAAEVTAFDLTSLGNCATGFGDPIVLYDHAADRWLLSEFGPGNSVCVFISQSPDPTGAYYAYQFTTSNFPDYPKYGVWPDGYYMSANESSPSAYALDRAKMLAGQPATSQRFTAPGLSGFGFEALTPADWDGTLAPPVGAPNIFMRHRDTEAHGPAGFPTEDQLELWAFHVDWANPANSSFTLLPIIDTAEFDSTLCGLVSFYAIAMPGVPKCSTSSLDPLREVVMFRLVYRNFGSHEALVGNFATDVTGQDDAGVRWFELRKSGAAPWDLYQEGTYAPDGDSRWMGAIAMDGSGNIALGYNVSSSSTYPSLRYAGRLASDPLGTLPQGEHIIIAGSGVNGSNRYGDYAAMSVDPVDDCTFWFTGEYNAASQWSTRIAAFRFDACGFPDFTLNAAPETQAICIPDGAAYVVNVGQVADFADPVTLSASGVPAGYSAGFSVNPVTPPGVSNLSLTASGSPAAGSYNIDIVGVAPTSTHTTTVGLDLFANAATVALVSPADGAVDQPLAPTFQWSGTGTSYTIEIATDAAFSNIVESATVAGTSYVSAGLAGNQTYYWRVTADNPCGANTSTARSFTTIDLLCSSPALAIPDNNPAGVFDDFSTGNTGTIAALNVSILISHTWVGDLVFELEHVDTGTSVVFYDRPGVPGSTFGCSGNDIDAVLDDEAASAVETECGGGVPTIDGTFRPGDPPADVFAAFDGEALAGTWRLTASDLAGGDTGTVNEWCLIPTVASGGVPAIQLAKTVGTDPAVCAVTDAISVDPGTEVTYCYEATNTGDVPLPLHTVVDSELGTILGPDFAYDLAPGASVLVTQTATIDVTTVNTATWSTRDVTGAPLAEDTDSATVNVVFNPAISLSKTVGTDPTACAVTDEITVVAGTEVTYCYEVTNTGNVSLPYHDLVDSELGAILTGFNYVLSPGTSVFVTESVSIFATTVNTATWTAYDTPPGRGIGAEAVDSATVNVEPAVAAIDVVKSVGTTPGVCAGTATIAVPAGTVVYYCYEVTNVGNITLSAHDLVDDQLGTLFTGLAYDLAPGASYDTVTAGLTISAPITSDTTNVATWTAYDVGGPSASDVATAVVTIEEPTDVGMTGFGGAGGGTALPILLTAAVGLALGAFVWRRRVVVR